jgi:hypothetical protein
LKSKQTIKEFKCDFTLIKLELIGRLDVD